MAKVTKASEKEEPREMDEETRAMIEQMREDLRVIEGRRAKISESVQGLKSSVRSLRKESETLVREQNRTHSLLSRKN